MRKILEVITVGSIVVMDGRAHTIIEDLGSGIFSWSDNQVPPAVGTFEFEVDTEENLNLVVL